MKKTLLLLIVLAMVIGLAAGASAYRLKLSTDTSMTGSIANDSNSTVPLAPVAGPEGRYGLYADNVVSDPPTLLYLMILDPDMDTWYGKVWNVGGSTGQIDLRFLAMTTTGAYNPSGT